MKEQIDLLLKDIKKLPTMSGVVGRVLNLVSNPDANINEVASEISKDPAITASIIKLSNSAYYRASKPVRTVAEAIMTLGLHTVKEMIMVSASKGVLQQDLKGYQLEADQMWMHSLVVAEIARNIVTLKKLPIPKDLAFTAGLLHDIGKVVLTQFFPRKVLDIRDELKNMETTFTEIEKKHFGYDHQEVGLKVLSAWNFPEELKEVVAYHHNPEEAKNFQLLTSVIHIANTLTVISGIGIDICGINQELSAFALKKTGITEKDIEALFMGIPEVQKQLQEMPKG